MKNKVNKNQGVKNLNARVGLDRTRAFTLIAKRLARGAGLGSGKRFRNSALAECQNRKIFVSLIEKILRARD